MKLYDIALIGGDARTAYMEMYFKKSGYSAICYGTEKIDGDDHVVNYAKSLKEAVEQARVVVGGIPLFKGGLLNVKQKIEAVTEDDLLKFMRKDQQLFGGVISSGFAKRCEEKGIYCHDFMKDEDFVIFNTIATAEGTILEAIKNQKTNLNGSDGLVLGYGKCGKVLAEKLRGIGHRVTVCARKQSDLAQAEAFGLSALPWNELDMQIGNYEYIYNTVPVVVIGEKLLSRMEKDVIILDIASAPGGVDYDKAKELGIKALHLPGLPGKYAPKISASMMTKLVISKNISDSKKE